MASSSSSSSKRWLNKISSAASAIFFLVIILQVPLFRVPCRSGMCTTPIEITSSQLIISEAIPTMIIKSLLYPGAVAKSLIKDMSVTSWEGLLNVYNLTQIKEAVEVPELQHLEVVVGSYFSVAGAFVGLVKAGRMSMFGTILLIWGLVKEGILGKPVGAKHPTYVYPTILIALVCAFLSVKHDVNKVVTSSPLSSIAKPLKSSSKSKLK